MSDDHQARLQAALDGIAGERVGCSVEWVGGFAAVRYVWWLRDLGAHGTVCTQHAVINEREVFDAAIAAACRTLRAALGVPEPREVRLREALRGLVEAYRVEQDSGDPSLDPEWQAALDALEDDHG